MIECRREFLKKQNVEDIDKCPIACRGYELSMPCTAANITNHARVIFEQLGIGKYALLEAARDLYETQEIGIIEEANPTAYLLRRNSANRLYQLGFTWAEMEFLMGHRIDDDYVNKKYLMEDEAITKISQKLLHHPANLFFGYENEDNLVVKDELESSISNNQSIYFNSMGEKGRYICYVVTNELDDIPKIECSNGINIVESTNDYYPLQQRRDVIVDISVINKKLYKEKIKEWRQKNE